MSDTIYRIAQSISHRPTVWFAVGCAALTVFGLTLTGCTNSDQFVTPRLSGPVLASESTNMRVVMGQSVIAEPLTPEPGDIWADLPTKMRIPTKPPGYNGIMPPGIPE